MKREERMTRLERITETDFKKEMEDAMATLNTSVERYRMKGYTITLAKISHRETPNGGYDRKVIAEKEIKGGET